MACPQTSYRQKLKANPEVLFFCSACMIAQVISRVCQQLSTEICPSLALGIFQQTTISVCKPHGGTAAMGSCCVTLSLGTLEEKSWGLTSMMKSYSALFPWFHLYCTRAHNALCVAASRLPQVRLCWKAAYKPERDSVLKVKGPFPKGRLFQRFLQNWIRF